MFQKENSLLTQKSADIRGKPKAPIGPEVNRPKDKITGLSNANCVKSPWWEWAGAMWVCMTIQLLLVYNRVVSGLGHLRVLRSVSGVELLFFWWRKHRYWNIIFVAAIPALRSVHTVYDSTLAAGPECICAVLR